MPNGKITVSLSFSLSKNVLNRNLTNSLQEQESDLFCFFQFPGLWSKFRTWVENHNLCGKCQWAQSKHCVGGFYSQGRRVTTW